MLTHKATSSGRRSHSVLPGVSLAFRGVDLMGSGGAVRKLHHFSRDGRALVGSIHMRCAGDAPWIWMHGNGRCDYRCLPATARGIL